MYLDYFQHLIATYGLVGIFISIAIENIGIPLPTEAAFLVGNQLIRNGNYSFWLIFTLIVLAQLASSIIAYYIGILINRGVIRQIHAKKIKEVSLKVTGWYKKYGPITVFATRLIGYVRPWSSIVAGIAEFPFIPFVVWTLLGSMVFVYITLHFTYYLVNLWLVYPIIQPMIVIGVFISFFGFIFAGIFQNKRNRKRL